MEVVDPDLPRSLAGAPVDVVGRNPARELPLRTLVVDPVERTAPVSDGAAPRPFDTLCAMGPGRRCVHGESLPGDGFGPPMPQSGRRLAEKELGEAFTPSARLHDDLGNGSQAGLAVVSALRFRLSGSGRAPPPCRQRIRGGQRRAVERDLGGTGYRRRPLRPIPMGAGRRVGALPSDGPGQEGVGSHGDPEARVAGRDCAADQDRGAAPVARSAYDDGRGRDVVGEPGEQGGGAAALPGIGTIAAMGLTVGEGLSFGEAAARATAS